MTRISHDIYLEAAEAYKAKHGGELSLAELSRAIGTPTGGLWYNAVGERKWTVEKWLTVLIYLGAAKVRGDSIVINTKFSREFSRSTKPDSL